MSVWLAKQLEALEHMLSNPSEEPIELSYPAIQTITQDFTVEIGRGGFGVVYLGSLPCGKIAVKKLFSSQDLDDKLFTDEVNCLIRAKHENIVRFLGYCAHTQGKMIKFEGKFVLADVRQRILCFEYVPNGNLYQYLKEEPSRDDWNKRYQMIRGICQGLNYLHEELINHLDLKPENVMLDVEMKPKISDFGLSRCFDKGQSRVFTRNIYGTQGYIAPEAIDSGEISYKSDIFSLGIVIIKLLAGRNKYDLENWQNLLDVDGPEAKVCIKIAQTCLHADQHKRPTIGKIIHELNELENVIRKTRNDGTSLKHQVVDFPSMQENKQCTSSGSAHLEVIDEEPMTVPPNSGTTSTPTEPGRVQLVIKSNKTAPLLENKQTVMLELTGGDYTIDRPGLDLVFVLDVGSYVKAESIKEVKTAMRFVVHKLGPIDRLSVVGGATTKLCPLREITESARQELLEVIDERIEASADWGSSIEDGLVTGLKVLADRMARAGRVAAIIIMCGIAQKAGNASKVSVGNVPVYTFGYGVGKHTALRVVAANSLGGTFSQVEQDVDKQVKGGLTMALSQCLAGLLTVSAQDLELTVAPVGDGTRIVKTTAGSYPQTQLKGGDGSVTVKLGNLYSREVRKVIVDVRLAACNIEHSFEFLKVTYSYSSSSSSSGGRERFVRPLIVWRTTQDMEEEMTELQAEKARLRALELIQQAAHVSVAQCHQLIVEAQKTVMLLDDTLLTTELQEIHRLFQTEDTYNLRGCAYMYSFVSSHNRQRSAARGSNTEIMRLFATPCMLLYLDQAMVFWTTAKPDTTDKPPETKSGGLRLWLWPTRS
ncbi:unnamed protein product [Alopecurus aequalis]